MHPMQSAAHSQTAMQALFSPTHQHPNATQPHKGPAIRLHDPQPVGRPHLLAQPRACRRGHPSASSAASPPWISRDQRNELAKTTACRPGRRCRRFCSAPQGRFLTHALIVRNACSVIPSMTPPTGSTRTSVTSASASCATVESRIAPRGPSIAWRTSTPRCGETFARGREMPSESCRFRPRLCR